MARSSGLYTHHGAVKHDSGEADVVETNRFDLGNAES
jgi:hypothetical protein